MKQLDSKLEDCIRKAISRWTTVPIIKLELLDPDASARIYTRIYFADTVTGKNKSALAMYFENTKVPEAGGDKAVQADDAYFELSKFFSTHGIPVPELYLDHRAEKLLIIEDCGPHHLADVIEGCSAEKRERLLLDATEVLIKIQKISCDSDSLASRRGFSAAIFETEMLEFPTFFLSRITSQLEAIEESKQFFSWLAAYVAAHPRTIVHRDYHAWNILVEKNNQLRVIDFQDALIGPRCYDLASLLHDRDTDQLIGFDLTEKIENIVLEKINAPRSELLTVLLQRDLKVAGRFAKLVGLGKPRYEEWIEGTTQRIVRTLKELSLINETAKESRNYLAYLKKLNLTK